MSTASEVMPLVESRGYTLVASLPSDPMFIEADAFRLWRALQNLLDNGQVHRRRRAYSDRRGA
jgi:hypothetical protein